MTTSTQGYCAYFDVESLEAVAALIEMIDSLPGVHFKGIENLKFSAQTRKTRESGKKPAHG